MDLARASRTGQDDEVRALLGAKVDPNLVTSGGTPALWRAAFNNHSSTVEILLDAGVVLSDCTLLVAVIPRYKEQASQQ